jgi:hypothetical protein
VEPSICPDPKNVTSEWLTSVLQFAGYDCLVADFQKQNVGTGQVGQNVRFALTYGSGSGPASIVGKFASDNPASRQTGIEMNNYFYEVRFYQELRQTLDIQTPAVLWTDINPDNHDFVLMMEDLAPALQGDQLQGCDKANAAKALNELAGLHGPRWADPTLDTIEWMPGTALKNESNLSLLWNLVFPGFVERYESQMSNEHLDLVRRLAEHLDDYSKPLDVPVTLIHGDYRLDNMMFGGPYPLAVVDWQTVTRGYGAADTAYFMGTGMEHVERRACERELLAGYYELLQAYGIGDYSFEQCWQDYRYFSFGGLIMAVIASMIVTRSERGDAMFMAMATRSAQMAIDLRAEEFFN